MFLANKAVSRVIYSLKIVMFDMVSEFNRLRMANWAVSRVF